MKELKIKLLSPTAQRPRREHNSAGFDLFADENILIPPVTTRKVKLGISACFDPAYVALLWDRSGMGSRGVHRFAGVIDADYTGEWAVCLFNASTEFLHVNVGDKIIQVLFQPVFHPQIEIVEELPKTVRGEGGFGSTDEKKP